MTEQEKLGQAIINMRKQKPALTASQCHDLVRVGHALDEINRVRIDDFSGRYNGNGNGSVRL